MNYWTLSRLGREFYSVVILTDPQLSAWEASFDQGTTWHTMTFDGVDNSASILVCGPDFVADIGDTTESVQLLNSVLPYIRCKDTPEVLVRSAPRIDIV